MKEKNTQFIKYEDSVLVERQYGSTMYVYVQTFNNGNSFDYKITSLSKKEFNFKVKLKSNTQIAYISSKEEIRDEYFSYELSSENDEIGFFANSKNPFHFHVRKDTVNLDKLFEIQIQDFFVGEKNILKQYDIEIAKKFAKKQEEVKEINEIKSKKEVDESKEAMEWLLKSKEERYKSQTFKEKINDLIHNFKYVPSMVEKITNNRAVRVDGVTVFEYIEIDNIIYELPNFEDFLEPKKFKQSSRMDAIDNSIV